MTQIRRSGLPESQGDRPSLGHRDDPASEQGLVGRTSALASGRVLVPTTPSRDRPDPASEQELVGRTSALASGRVLVPTTPSRASEAYSISHRPPAAFLAQLIATALQAPQTRARRRAEPGDASAVYATATAGCAHLGGTLYRSM